MTAAKLRYHQETKGEEDLEDLVGGETIPMALEVEDTKVEVVAMVAVDIQAVVMAMVIMEGVEEVAMVTEEAKDLEAVAMVVVVVATMVAEDMEEVAVDMEEVDMVAAAVDTEAAMVVAEEVDMVAIAVVTLVLDMGPKTQAMDL